MSKEIARKMRRQGKTLNEIMGELGRSKTTIYGWIKDIPFDIDRSSASQKSWKKRRESNPQTLNEDPVVSLSGNTKKVGDCSQLMVLARLALVGRTPLLPYGDNLRYDLALDEDGRLVRVQCKTGRIDSGAIKFEASTNYAHRNRKRRSYRGQIEYFGVYCPDNDKCYLVPVDHVGKTTGILRVNPARNNQTKGIRWAKDYEIK